MYSKRTQKVQNLSHSVRIWPDSCDCGIPAGYNALCRKLDDKVWHFLYVVTLHCGDLLGGLHNREVITPRCVTMAPG